MSIARKVAGERQGMRASFSGGYTGCFWDCGRYLYWQVHCRFLEKQRRNDKGLEAMSELSKYLAEQKKQYLSVISESSRGQSAYQLAKVALEHSGSSSAAVGNGLGWT
ncbi:MAG: hypothetical protein CMF12_12280 [Idiomarina sp.]|uniref:hypothetical protein n=1 Tax=Idiomarina sp. TaxID=1874361 RepID=UPI000C62CAE6|nr:hypothetical protein [Idiomarina sp.]MBT43292.1 hypothetical protein [Idiomarina sp.]